MADLPVLVGEIQRGEDLVEVSPLKANRSYTLRLQSVTSGNVSTASTTTRFQTLPGRAFEGEYEHKLPAKIQANPFPICVQSTQVSLKEHALSSQAAPKPLSGRRSHAQSHIQAADVDHSNATSDSEEDDSPELVQSLTQRLEDLKRQKEDLQNQIEDDEADAKMGQIELQRERDQLKQELKEKEDYSNEMRKQGNLLEKTNRTAQNKKAAKERVLSQKRAERQNAVRDIERWAAESSDVQQHVETMEVEIKSMTAEYSQQMQELRQLLDVDQSAIRGIEEDIRIKGSQIKDLEQRNDALNEPSSLQSSPSDERTKDEVWQSRVQALQIRLQSSWNALNQSKLEEQHAEERLTVFSVRHTAHPEELLSAHYGANLLSTSRTRLKTAGPPHSRSSTHPSSFNYYAITGHSDPALHFSATSGNPSGSHISGKSHASDGTGGFLQASVDDSTHGGLLSPAANDLLPSYLLGDDDQIRRPLAREGSEGAPVTRFTHHAFTNSDVSVQGPNSPLSANSRAGSAITSPHSSLQNVSSFNAEYERLAGNQTNATQESDHSGGPFTQSSSKFASLFSSPFGRQRGKTSGPEPPALGTLKQGQSQSFPRNIDDETGEASGLRRRRGSHGAWPSPVAGLIGKVGTQTQEASARARASSGRSGRLNMLKSRLSTWEPTGYDEAEYINSRPSSTYSYDHQISRPSSDNPSIWGPTGESLVRRDSPMNAIWSGAAGPWSRNPSRRASIQHGSSTNLSLGSTPLILEDPGRTQSKHRAEQAPIGTRPALRRTVTPKLNPAAPSFKTLFSRGETKKGAKAEKAGNKRSAISKSRESEKSDVDTNETPDETSPPASRLSRDAHSITTATSTADSHDSFEKGTSGTTSDSPTPKESLMQKITRKSSSSKFNVPWSKERGMFSKRNGDLASNENDMDVPSEGHTLKVHDNAANNQRDEKTSRAWASIRRKSKRGTEMTEMADQESDMGDDEI